MNNLLSRAIDSLDLSSCGYEIVPIVESWGERGWKAGLLVRGDDARGDRPAKSMNDRVFDSREAALEFARSEYGDL